MVHSYLRRSEEYRVVVESATVHDKLRKGTARVVLPDDAEATWAQGPGDRAHRCDAHRHRDVVKHVDRRNQVEVAGGRERVTRCVHRERRVQTGLARLIVGMSLIRCGFGVRDQFTLGQRRLCHPRLGRGRSGTAYVTGVVVRY